MDRERATSTSVYIESFFFWFVKNVVYEPRVLSLTLMFAKKEEHPGQKFSI